MSKILSISVASYNVEKFIEKTILSFTDSEVIDKIELLIVDDGSKDSTAEIVKGYQEKYPDSVKYIYQDNAGPGSTVNNGFKHATGKYFRMVDGDDWVDTHNLKQYIEFLENNEVDVVYTDYSLVDNDSMETVPQKLNYKNNNVLLKYDDVCSGLEVSMHNVTYLTSVLNEIDFKIDNCFYTDMEYLLYPVKNLKTIAVLDLNIYMYRVSLSTQSMNINSMIRNKKMHELVFTHIFNDFIEHMNDFSNEQKKFVRKKLLTMAGAHLSIIIAQKPCSETKKELKEFIKFLGKDKELLNSFLELKTVKLIVKSNYLLFNSISKMHRKKTGVID